MAVNIKNEIGHLTAICKEKNSDTILFSFEHNRIRGSVIFFLNSLTFLFGIKDFNVGWLAPVTDGVLSGRLPTDVFKRIKDMLDVVEYVKTDRGEYAKHSTAGLFQTISTRMRIIQTDEVMVPSDEEMIESIRKTRTNDKDYDKEGELPFFKTWSRNTNRGRVKVHNLEKTKRVFGKEIENHCRKNNISSVWSATPTERSLLFRKKVEEITNEI